MAMAPAMAPGMSPVMNDGAVAAPPRAAVGASLPFGADRDELIERLVPQLPDASRFLERYLRQAARLRLNEAGLEIAWSDAQHLGKRIIERPENTQAVEATLTRLAGRPMRIRSMVAAGMPEAAAPPPAAARHPAEPLDAPMLRDAAALDDEAIGVESAPDDFESDEPRPPSPAAPRQVRSPERAAAPGVDPAPSQPIDRRSAREKAQALLAHGGEVARRAKLLREMFHGRPIDEQGQPISI
jgi:hypothetical protein